MCFKSIIFENNSDSKVHVAHMGPSWVLSDPGGSHVGPMNLAIREGPVHAAYSKSWLVMSCWRKNPGNTESIYWPICPEVFRCYCQEKHTAFWFVIFVVLTFLIFMVTWLIIYWREYDGRFWIWMYAYITLGILKMPLKLYYVAYWRETLLIWISCTCFILVW